MRWSKTLTVVDCHAEGEIGRVVTGGVPPLAGSTVFEQRAQVRRRVSRSSTPGASSTPARP